MLDMFIGFHAFTMVTAITYDDANEIRKTFQELSKDKDSKIKHFQTGKIVDAELPNGTTRKIVPNYTAKYYNEEGHRLIEWIVKFCNYRKGLNFYYLQATINPITLLGKIDYFNISNQSYLLGICERYNAIIKDISNLIPEFKHYIPDTDLCNF